MVSFQCKGEPYRFSGQQDPLVQTDTQTQILLLLYKDIKWSFKKIRPLDIRPDIWQIKGFYKIFLYVQKWFTYQPLAGFHHKYNNILRKCIIILKTVNQGYRENTLLSYVQSRAMSVCLNKQISQKFSSKVPHFLLTSCHGTDIAAIATIYILSFKVFEFI